MRPETNTPNRSPRTHCQFAETVCLRESPQIRAYLAATAENVHLDAGVTSATTAFLCSGMPGVVWSAIASHAISTDDSGTPYFRRKSRAAFAPSTSKRNIECRYCSVSPGQGTEQEDPSGVVIEKVGLLVAN